ncbi:MAG: tetratricopeptide repeat protein [Ignavibacteriales bacterium]
MKKIILTIFILAATCLSSAQSSHDALKSEALKHMQAGRFGEAIDLLNKFVSAYPHLPEGLNLRGFCFEKRGQLGEAVLDYRRALKLAPNNSEIRKNLTRAENTWYPLLYKKIEGHKREIAINPQSAVNYLEIGKCMKDLGKWDEAENWYDEYLKLETASQDEIIRYSEILAHNNHLVKGEKILKAYTDKFPDDQRLWSRYGFFTMWLGKNKIAVKAFENALAIKPYFKEAQDGLDQAKGKAYIFEWTDTTARYKKNAQPKEYAIDKYYRILKTKPSDNTTRVQLVDELLKVNRLEEAYQQVQILAKTQNGDQKIQALYDSVLAVRESILKKRIQDYSARLEKNPSDKEAVLKLAEYYSDLFDYDNATKILSTYLESDSSSDNFEIRFRLAQYSAWNRDFSKALEQANFLLNKDPENLNYQLLRSQLAVWTDQDFNLAKGYLENIVKKEPKNFEAILAIGTLYSSLENFDEAKKYLEIARSIDPTSKYVEQLETRVNYMISRAEEKKIFAILEDGRKLVVEQHDCQGALLKYDEYFSKVTPTNLLLLEYADVNSCAKNYQKTIDIYTKILSEEYTFDVALLRAKAYLWSNDSANALVEFKKLDSEAPDNFEVKMLLGDSYYAMHEYSEARDVYEKILEGTTDSTKIALIQPRLGWLPVSGINSIFATFPNYVGFAPQFSYYSDNLNLKFQNTGGRLELGLTGYLTIGATFSRGTIQSNITSRSFTVFKGNLFLRFSKYLSFSTGLGNLTYQGTNNHNVADANIRFDKENSFSLLGSYEKTDAGIILFSTRLIDFRINANVFRFSGYYQNQHNLRFSGLFSYLNLSDGNGANDLQLRLGKSFEPEVFVGYEYVYSNYARKSNFYYSPKNFESHSIWGEWDIQKNAEFNLTLGAKIGYVPLGDFILREISGSTTYKILNSLSITGKLAAGGTFRFDTSYNYVSANLSAYWSF